MASTFSDLGIELMSTGENAGTWGDKTNTNLQIVEKAIAGYVEKSIAGGAQTTALSITDGTTTESDSIARHAVIKLTGSITGNQIVTVPDSIEKVYIITNGTSGAYTVQFKTASGTGITFGVSEKTTRLVYSDGTNLVDAGFGGALDIEGRELVLDADGDTTITADTDDQIDIKIGGTDQIKLVDGAIVPVTDNDIDLGTSSLEFKDAFFDGTVTADAFAGPLTGNVTGNVSGTAATVTTAAQSNITSLGTLTTLTVDNIITNGSTIGHTSDTDLITLADGIATVAGEVSMTTLDIGGTNVTSTAAELNLLDGRDATHLAVPGKLEGTDFTDSLLIGHSTTGSLNAATDNTGVGIGALDALTSGDNNTGVGQDAGTELTTGTRNTMIGSGAGDSITEAANNTLIGSLAGATISNAGHYNTLIGKSAGSNISTGDGNVVIGVVDADSATGDRQLKIAGYDGSTTTTWISGDSSGNLTTSGVLTANAGVVVDNITIDGTEIDVSSSFTLDVAGNITLDSSGSNINFTKSGTTYGVVFESATSNLNIRSLISDADIIFSGNDGGSTTTVLTLDMSEAGAATFNSTVTTTGLIIGSTAVTSTAAELNLLDGKDATHLAVPGKIEGTNFTNSLLVGHATTGTLSSAENNTAVGIEALDALTSGIENTAVGFNAGGAITSGGRNVALGRDALKTATTAATYSTAVGYYSMRDGAGGFGNTGIGYHTLRDVTGVDNIAIGANSGRNITSGSGNVIIGAYVDAPSATGSRQLKITGYDGSTTTNWISGDSDGVVTLADDLVIKDGGTIGVSSDADSITIASNGVVTFSQTPVNSAGAAFVTDDPTALAIALG